VLIARAVRLAALTLAASAAAQTTTEPPLPPAETAPPPVAPPPITYPNEIVIPQYPEGTSPPSEGPVTLTPEAMQQWRQKKLFFAIGTSNVVQGVNASPLDREEFYTLVGRPDLAARMEDGKRRQVWFIVGGLFVAAAGIGGGIALSNTNEAPITYTPAAVKDPTLCNRYPYTDCTITNQTWQNWVGLALVVVGGISGGILIALGIAATNPVTTLSEDKDLVGAYNDLLLQRLASKSVRPSAVPAVGVGFGSGGGMLQAGWRF
jgi:hypothetical protein